MIGASVGGSNEEASSDLLMASARDVTAFLVSNVGVLKMLEVVTLSVPSISCNRPSGYTNFGRRQDINVILQGRCKGAYVRPLIGLLDNRA